MVHQAHHAVFEIRRLDAVEACLLTVMLFQRQTRRLVDAGLHGVAVALRRQAQEKLFHMARVIAGDFRMALLMALDIRRQRAPDQRQALLVFLRLLPARQDQVGGDGHFHRIDATGMADIRIGDGAAEFDPRRAGMAHSRPHRLRAPVRQFPVQFSGGAAVNIEISHGLAGGNLRCGHARHKHEKGNAEGGGKAEGEMSSHAKKSAG